MGVLLPKQLKVSLVSVSGINDRLMSVKLGIGDTIINVICAYAPQVGCEEEETSPSGDRCIQKEKG